MRKQYFLLLLIIIAIIISCGGTPKFSDVAGKKWKLIEVSVDDRNIFFNRNTLSSESAGDIFTFNFDDQNINMIGAPSPCSGRYTLGDNQAISLGSMNTTQMDPLRQPEKLRESDFFVYMQNVYKWNVVSRKLELYSKTENGTEVKMVFSL